MSYVGGSSCYEEFDVRNTCIVVSKGKLYGARDTGLRSVGIVADRIFVSYRHHLRPISVSVPPQGLCLDILDLVLSHNKGQLVAVPRKAPSFQF